MGLYFKKLQGSPFVLYLDSTISMNLSVPYAPSDYEINDDNKDSFRELYTNASSKVW